MPGSVQDRCTSSVVDKLYVVSRPKRGRRAVAAVPEKGRVAVFHTNLFVVGLCRDSRGPDQSVLAVLDSGTDEEP